MKKAVLAIIATTMMASAASAGSVTINNNSDSWIGVWNPRFVDRYVNGANQHSSGADQGDGTEHTIVQQALSVRWESGMPFSFSVRPLTAGFGDTHYTIGENDHLTINYGGPLWGLTKQEIYN